MDGLKSFPIVPQREAVRFHGVTTPIGAGRKNTIRAIEQALGRPERLVFAVAQRDNLDEVSPEALFTKVRVK